SVVRCTLAAALAVFVGPAAPGTDAAQPGRVDEPALAVIAHKAIALMPCAPSETVRTETTGSHREAEHRRHERRLHAAARDRPAKRLTKRSSTTETPSPVCAAALRFRGAASFRAGPAPPAPLSRATLRCTSPFLRSSCD